MTKTIKRILMVFAVMLSVFAFASCGEEKANQEALEKAINELRLNENPVENFDLPQSVGDVEITWASNDAAIKIEGNQAIVSVPEFGANDATVKLTATLKIGEQTQTKEFNITIKASTVDPKIALDAACLEILEEIVMPANYGKGTLLGNFTVPTKLHGLNVVWSSNCDFVTVDEEGNVKVTVPTFEEGDKEGKLTATLNKAGGTATVEFPFKLIKAHTPEVAAAISGLELTGAIKDFQRYNFQVPTYVSGASGVTITWKSNNDAIKLQESAEMGKLDAIVTRPAKGEQDVKVTLKVTITAEVEELVDKYEKEYEFVVKAIPTSEVMESIAAIKAIDLTDTKLESTGSGENISYYKEVTFTGTVVYVLNDNKGFYVADEDNTIYCYGQTTCAVGDKVTVTGLYKLYYTQPEIDKATTVAAEEAPTMDFSAPSSKTVEEIVELSKNDVENYGSFFKVYGKVVKDGSDFFLEGASTKRLALYYKAEKVDNKACYEAYEGKWINALIVLHDFHSTQLVWRVMPVAEGITEAAEPTLTDEEKLAYTKAVLASLIPANKDVYGVINLPTEIASYPGVTIAWASNKAEVLNNQGFVLSYEEDTEVKLSATITSGEKTEIFEVTVVAKAIDVKTVMDVIEGIDNKASEVFVIEVNVLENVNSNYGNLFVGDDTGVLYVYGCKEINGGAIAKGDKVRLLITDYKVYEGSVTKPEYTREAVDAIAIKLSAEAEVATPTIVNVTPQELAVKDNTAFKDPSFVNGYQSLVLTGVVNYVDDNNTTIELTVTEGEGEAAKEVTYKVLVNKSSKDFATLKSFNGVKVNYACVAYGMAKTGEDYVMKVYGLGDLCEKWIQQPTLTVPANCLNIGIWGADYKNNTLFYTKSSTVSKTSTWAARVGACWDEAKQEYVVTVSQPSIGTTPEDAIALINDADLLLVITEEGNGNYQKYDLANNVKVGDILRFSVGDSKKAAQWLEGKATKTLGWDLLFYPADSELEPQSDPLLPDSVPFSVDFTTAESLPGFTLEGVGTYGDKSLKFSNDGHKLVTNTLFNTEKLTVKFNYKMNGEGANGKVTITALDATKTPIENGKVTIDVTSLDKTLESVNLAVENIAYVEISFDKETGNFALYDLAITVYKTEKELNTEAVNAAMAKVTVNGTATEDFIVPVIDSEENVAIAWVSSKEAIAIDASGNAKVTLDNNPIEVVLTATFARGEGDDRVEKTKEFTVTLPKADGVVVSEALLNSLIEEGQNIVYYKYTTSNVTDGSNTYDTQYSYSGGAGTGTAGFGGSVIIIGNDVHFLGMKALIELNSTVLGKTALTQDELRPYGKHTDNNVGLVYNNGVVSTGNGRLYGVLYVNTGTEDVSFTGTDTYGRNYNGACAQRVKLTLNPETGLYTVAVVADHESTITLAPGEYLFCPSTGERYVTGLYISTETGGVLGAAGGKFVDGANNVQITTIEEMYDKVYGTKISNINLDGGSANKSVAQVKQEFLTDFYNWCLAKSAFTAEEVSLETFIGVEGEGKTNSGTWVNYTGGAGNPSSLFTAFNSGAMVNFMLSPSTEEGAAASARTNAVIADTTYFLNDAVYNAKWGPMLDYLATFFGSARCWTAPTNYFIYELGRYLQGFGTANGKSDADMALLPTAWRVELPATVELAQKETYKLPSVMYKEGKVFGGWIDDEGNALSRVGYKQNATCVWYDALPTTALGLAEVKIGEVKYDTIALALEAAVNGDVITITDGEIAGEVVINKEVTIKGANAGRYGYASYRLAETVFTGRLVIDANNVTVDGIKISGGSLEEATTAVLLKAVDNFTFKNSIIDKLYADEDASTNRKPMIGNSTDEVGTITIIDNVFDFSNFEGTYLLAPVTISSAGIKDIMFVGNKIINMDSTGKYGYLYKCTGKKYVWDNDPDSTFGGQGTLVSSPEAE